MAEAMVASKSGAIRLRLVARSSRIDLAVLCQLTDDVPVAPMRKADRVRAGEPVFAAGPIALNAGADRIVLRGNVGSTGQHDARFGPGLIAELPGARPGFSGTPLLDGAGRVLGMLTAIRAANTSQASASVPARPVRTAIGAAIQAFVVDATAISDEVVYVLAEAASAPAGSSAGACPG